MNAIEFLLADHDAQRQLLKDLTSTDPDDAERREELLQTLRAGLDAHMIIEEEIFYPAFREAAEKSKDRVMIFEAVEEHRAAGDLVMPDLLSTDRGSEKFSGRAKVLKELVQHHIDEEEKDLFPRARELLDADQLDELGRKMEERRTELLEAGPALMQQARKREHGQSQPRH